MINSTTPASNNTVANGKVYSTRILYGNDFHGQTQNLNGFMAECRDFQKFKAENPDTTCFTLSGGDNVSGGDSRKNNLVYNLLEYCKFDASAVGNHEFDAGIASFLDGTKGKSLTYLGANYEDNTNTGFKNAIQKSIVKEVNGTKYGMVGLLPIDLKTVVSKKEYLENFEVKNLDKTIEALQSEIDKLEAQGVNKIIVLSHVGVDVDKQIATKISGADVIVGGHSHTTIEGAKQGENLFTTKRGEPIIVLQTGENGKNFGILDVEFDEKGIIKKLANDLEAADTSKSPFLSFLKDAALGKSPQVAQINHVDPLPQNRRLSPCGWTNLITDAMRFELNTDIAIINSANVRAVPKAGILSERDISETTPLKNTLLTKKMTEREIVAAFAQASKASLSHETGEPGLLQASGIAYKADSTGNLLEMSFVSKNGQKTPIDVKNPSDKIYTVAYDSFVADGREYPAMMPSAHQDKEIAQTYAFDKDKTLIDYMKKMPNKDSLTIVDDGRLEVVGAQQQSTGSKYNPYAAYSITAKSV